MLKEAVWILLPRLQLFMLLSRRAPFQLRNRTTGVIMSFNQKSDVKQHLSSRRHKTLLPFRPASQSDITDVSTNELRNENHDIPALGQKSVPESSAVTPITSCEIPVRSGNSVDETTDKKS